MRSHAPKAGAVSKQNAVAVAKHAFSVADVVGSDGRGCESELKEGIEQRRNKRFEPVINNGMRSLYEFYTVTQRLVKFVFRVLEQWLLLDK